MTMKLREVSDIPAILLTAKREEFDKITGLNLGQMIISLNLFNLWYSLQELILI